MNARLAELALVALAGALLAAAAAPLIGWWSAVAVPAGYFEAFRTLGSIELGHLAWSYAAVGLPGAGIVVFAGSLAALTLATAPRAPVIVALLTGYLLGAHALVPALHGLPGPELLASRPWWAWGIELAVLTSALAAGWLYGRRHRPVDPA